MTLKAFLRTLAASDRTAFAERCGTTLGHLNNVAYGLRPGSDRLALAIERETDQRVTVAELRPEFAEALAKAGYRWVDDPNPSSANVHEAPGLR